MENESGGRSLDEQRQEGRQDQNENFDPQKVAEENIRKHREQAGNRNDSNDDRSDNTDREAHRDPEQSHDYKGEAQNVNDDEGRPLNEQELEHSRDKANSGRQRPHTGG